MGRKYDSIKDGGAGSTWIREDEDASEGSEMKAQNDPS